MSKKDSYKVDWSRLTIGLVLVIWLMMVVGTIWESCTLF